VGRIRQARRRAGLSQEELAKAADVSPATVVQVELGHRQPQGRTLRKLAGALGVEVADLIEEEVTAAPKTLSRPEFFELPGLTAALQRHNMRLSELAFRAGMTPGEVLDYEIGAKKPEAETIGRLADALGAAPSELVFPAEQVEEHLAENERQNARIDEELAEKSANEIREERLKNPTLALMADAYAKNEAKRQAERRKDATA